jgi:hypothetical protein
MRKTAIIRQEGRPAPTEHSLLIALADSRDPLAGSR